MKKILKLALVCLFVLAALLAPIRLVLSNESEEQLGSLNDKIAEYQAKLKELAGEKQTLSSTIAYLTTEINLTETEIAKTEAELSVLGVEIEDLSGRIESIDISLDELTTLFLERVKESYKQPPAPILTLFDSGGFSEILRKTQYIKRVRDHDREVMVALEKSRLDYDAQKTAKEEKQEEVEALQSKLESQVTALAIQKVAKDQLLAQTKSDESKYQQLLAQALAEKAAVEQALISGVEVGPVEEGDPIALIGNSGYPSCSTGKHLHLEFRKNGSWVDPGQYLQPKSIYDHDENANVSLGSGSWPWPISDPIRLTQHFGQTPYSWRYTYSGGIHTGLDMVSDSSDVIRAPAPGILYKSSQGCGGSIINIVYIDHGDDLISLYLHVQ